jgi:hypothetical protein
MSFTNRLALVVPSFGTPISNDTQNLRQTVALSGASTTVTVPSTGSFAPPPRTGWIRVKIYNGGSSTTLASFTVMFTDGTNNVYVANFPATAVPNVAASGLDVIIPFEVDIVPTSMSVVAALTVGTTTASMDVEIAYAN